MFTANAVRAEMRGHVKLAVDLAPNTNRKAALAWAAQAIGLPLGRIRSLFYGEARRIEAHEADQIRAYYKSATRLITARQEYDKYVGEVLANSPGLARFLPPALGKSQGEVRAEAAIASPLRAKRKRARK